MVLKPESSDFWEAQWTSGFVALRFLEKAKIAYNHFELLFKNVTQPVTFIARVLLAWIIGGKMGDKELAISWYKMLQNIQFSFYGQLAIHKHRLIDSVGSKMI